jgi:hypothetical protein
VLVVSIKWYKRSTYIPLGGNDPLIRFEARFRFLRDLTALNNSMMLMLKLLWLRSKVSKFSNLDKLLKPVVNLLKNCRKKTMQFTVFKRKIAFYSLLTRYVLWHENKWEREISNRLNPTSPSFQKLIILHKIGFTTYI